MTGMQELLNKCYFYLRLNFQGISAGMPQNQLCLVQTPVTVITESLGYKERSWENIPCHEQSVVPLKCTGTTERASGGSLLICHPGDFTGSTVRTAVRQVTSCPCSNDTFK